MAPYIPFPDVLQYNLRFQCAGQRVEFVWHFSFSGNAFGDAAADLYQLIRDGFWTDIRSNLSQDLVNTESYIVDLTTQTSGVVTLGPFTQPAGGSTIMAAPNNVAFCVTHRTAQRGRSFRGRTYVAGIPADQIEDSRLSSGSRSVYVAAFNTLRVDANAQLYPFVIASRKENGVFRTIGVATPVTASVSVDDVVDTQQRRLPGRGS